MLTCHNSEIPLRQKSGTILKRGAREFWRILFWPTRGVDTTGWRVGYTELKHSAISSFCARCMCTLIALVRCYDTMPVNWVSAKACPLDKKNGKEGCEAVRLTDIVQEMGHSFVGTLLERGIRIRSARPYASGYQNGRSRLEAIIHQRVIVHRARVAGRNFAVSKNAFASPGHDQQDACLGARLRHVDVRLCQQSYRDARVVLQCADGKLVVKLGCGALQGTTCTIRLWTPGFNGWNLWTSLCGTLCREKLWTLPSLPMQMMWQKANFSNMGKSSSRWFLRKTWPFLTPFRKFAQLSTLASRNTLQARGVAARGLTCNALTRRGF